MYLSRIHIPWPQAKDVYQLHCALWQLFPEHPEDNRDFLFRVERQKNGFGSDILLQSSQKPAANNQTSYIIANREYAVTIENKQRLRFRLRANPTKKISDERGRLDSKGQVKKCRIPLIREEDQHTWLERKLAPVGSIEMLSMQMEAPLYFRKRKEQRAGKIQPVLFDGILRVNDPDSFLVTITKGIGPAKAFGCGLLSIAPA